jgi:hypothetical protein
VVRLQCVAALVLGAAVLLTALFWLPPFAGRGRGSDGAPDPGAVFRGELSSHTPVSVSAAALRDLVFDFGSGASLPGCLSAGFVC